MGSSSGGPPLEGMIGDQAMAPMKMDQGMKAAGPAGPNARPQGSVIQNILNALAPQQQAFGGMWNAPITSPYSPQFAQQGMGAGAFPSSVQGALQSIGALYGF